MEGKRRGATPHILSRPMTRPCWLTGDLMAGTGLTSFHPPSRNCSSCGSTSQEMMPRSPLPPAATQAARGTAATIFQVIEQLQC